MVQVVPIGIPDKVIDKFKLHNNLITEEYVSRTLPIRKPDGHLVNFIDTIFEYYYLPNYDEFPDIQKQTAILSYMKEVLSKYEAEALKNSKRKLQH